MDLIVGGRGSGKTAKLIELSEKTGFPIVVSSQMRADDIRRQAKVMKRNIPDPVVRERPRGAKGCSRVLVDDAQSMLESVIGAPVEAATFELTGIEYCPKLGKRLGDER